jgi:hypothetical protein
MKKDIYDLDAFHGADIYTPPKNKVEYGINKVLQKTSINLVYLKSLQFFYIKVDIKENKIHTEVSSKLIKNTTDNTKYIFKVDTKNCDWEETVLIFNLEKNNISFINESDLNSCIINNYKNQQKIVYLNNFIPKSIEKNSVFQKSMSIDKIKLKLPKKGIHNKIIPKYKFVNIYSEKKIEPEIKSIYIQSESDLEKISKDIKIDLFYNVSENFNFKSKYDRSFLKDLVYCHKVDRWGEGMSISYLDKNEDFIIISEGGNKNKLGTNEKSIVISKNKIEKITINKYHLFFIYKNVKYILNLNTVDFDNINDSINLIVFEKDFKKFIRNNVYLNNKIISL